MPKPGGPPTDLSPSDLFLKLLDREDPHIDVEFPRDGIGNVRMHLLTDLEVKRAKLKALDEARKQIKDEDRGTEVAKELEGDLIACNILQRSLRLNKPLMDSEGRARYPFAFMSSEDVSAKLTAHEIASLFAAYMSLQRKFGPGEHDFDDPETVNAWIRRLKDGADSTPFWRLDWHALAELFHCLAQRALCLSKVLNSPPEQLQSYLESLPTEFAFDTGSAGAQQDSLFRSSDEDDDTLTAEQAGSVLDAIE